MIIEKNEFEILVFLEENKIKITQRIISKEINFSLGKVNKLCKNLSDKKLINKEYKLTNLGYKILEPYKVEKAIIIAAGFGSRLVPVTLKTPKPLIKVNGISMIETTLKRLKELEINDITIVRGYKKEQFDTLLTKYNNIKFVDNNLYSTCNNISSIYMVKDQLKKAYILEADLYVKNPKIIRKYEYSSNILGQYVEKSDDWCLNVENNIIKELKRGGIDTYLMYGITYFDEISSEKFAEHANYVFNELPGGKEKYWDQIHLEVFQKEYKINIRKCKKGDIIEIDTFDELKQIDNSYNDYR